MKKLFVFVLFLTWLLLMVVYIRAGETPFLSLNELSSLGKLELTQAPNLQYKERFSGNFVTKHSNLNTILIRFEGILNADRSGFNFRLREDGKEDWYHSAHYDVPITGFSPGGYFAFDFPKITDSAQRSYIFEVETDIKLPGVVAAVSTNYPAFITRSSFTISELLSNGKLLSNFATDKFTTMLGEDEFLMNLLIFSLPLVFYLLFLIFGFNYLFPTIFVVLAIAVDVFFLHKVYDFLWIAVMFAWLLTAFKFVIDSRVSIIFSLFFLWMTYLFQLIERRELTNKTQVWIYVFLTLFVFQKIYELKRRVVVKVLVQDYFKGLVISLYNDLVFVYLLTKGRYRAAAISLDYLLRVGASSLLTAEKISLPLNHAFAIGVTSLHTTEQILQKVGLWLQILIVSMIRLIPLLFLWLVASKVKGYWAAYQNFYPSFQDDLFFNRTGVYLTALYILAVISIIILSLLFRRIRMSLIACVVIFATIQLGDLVFHKTTDFSRVVLWKVRGNETAEPWVDVFIDGRNLNEAPFIGRVFVNGVEQRVMGWSKNEVIFRTDPNITTSGRLMVVTSDGRKSNLLDFKYRGNR